MLHVFFIVEFPGWLSDIRHFDTLGEAGKAAAYLGPAAKVRLVRY